MSGVNGKQGFFRSFQFTEQCMVGGWVHKECSGFHVWLEGPVHSISVGFKAWGTVCVLLGYHLVMCTCRFNTLVH